MDEHPELDEQDAPAPVNTKALLIGLGGLTVIAVVLLAVRATRAPKPTPVSELAIDADWATSLQHFADACEVRFAGIDNRLAELASDRVRAAATSVAPEPLVGDNGVGPTVERVPPDVPVGADDPSVPGPAAVSTQP